MAAQPLKGFSMTSPATLPCTPEQIHWGLEAFRVLPTALVALLVGFFGLKVQSAQNNISQAQHRVSEERLNLDLFERRLKIFHATWAAASGGLSYTPASTVPVEFTNLYPEASFLFGPEVEEYMKEVTQHLNQASLYLMHFGHGPVRQDLVEKHLENQQWLINAATVGVRRVFAPYLDFSAWRPGPGRSQ
jgi:hypothetical protein